MLIKALCDYAEKQQASSSQNASVPEYYRPQKISYRIVLSPEGKLLDILPQQHLETYYDKKGKEKQKDVPDTIYLPMRNKPSIVQAYYLDHRPLYIFGLNYVKENGQEIWTPDDETNKARRSHKAFVEHELAFMDGLNSEICTAYRRFLETWDPEQETENPVLRQLGAAYSGSYFGFTLGIGKANLEEDPELIAKYQKICRQDDCRTDEPADTVCSILGERLSIARKHNTFDFPNQTGCRLVCMKHSAYESYCKEKSFNSGVSEKAMKLYTDQLNKLLQDRQHHVILEGMTVVFFAMCQNDETQCDFFASMLGGSMDQQTEQSIQKLLTYAKGGYTGDPEAIRRMEEMNNTTFYIVGLTNTKTRVSQKFIYRDRFGNLIQNLLKHQEDLRIREQDTHPIPFKWINKELVSPKSSNKDVPPPLESSIILAALQNTRYPDALLATVVRRVKTDQDDENDAKGGKFIKLNRVRAGIIKACLNRKNHKEEITMAWNEENRNPAYICGGLFAVYEKIQKDATKGPLNRTIKDAYFSSACSRPASVFPTLAKLSQNHLHKLDEERVRVSYGRRVGGLMNQLEGEFPQTLSLDDQGRFIIGYYQMNQKLYTRNEETKEDET